MAATQTEEPQPAPSTTGYIRVPLWFGIWGLVFLVVFLYRVQTLNPNWLILGPLMVAPLALSPRSLKEMLNRRSGAANEKIMQVSAALGGVLAFAAVAYGAWRFGPAGAVRIMDAYVIPMLIPIVLVYAGVALHVERKHKLRVFVGNRGWLFVPPPSNSTHERDARNSGARPSV
jgi:sterol desaturase/sphingolipid hydroxylase (fatty acid hydroxylase superfamily)